MFYTAANTKSSWDALDYVYKLSNYSHILTQEIAFITKLKKKTAKCFQAPTFTLTVCSAHLNDLKM